MHVLNLQIIDVTDMSKIVAGLYYVTDIEQVSENGTMFKIRAANGKTGELYLIQDSA